MMDGTAVSKIAELAQAAAGETVEIAGRKFSTTALLEAPATRLPQALEVHTLDAVVGYFASAIDSAQRINAGDDLVVHVVSPTMVEVRGMLHGEHSRRSTYVRALYKPPFNLGHFERFRDSETFIVGLQACFADVGDRAAVLSIVGNITDENVRVAKDDGVTQEVTVKKGVVRAAAAVVPNPVTLAPFRTFPEVAQPASLFVLRVRGGEAQPECALFEADGGKWELVAIQAIAAYLKDKLPNVPILR